MEITTLSGSKLLLVVGVLTPKKRTKVHTTNPNLDLLTLEGSEQGLSAKLKRLLLTVTESPEVAAFITLLLVFLFFAVSAPNFLSAYALSNILTFASIYGIVVVGVAFLMISGEFDLSVGSNLAVAGYIFLLSLLAGIHPLVAMLLALGVSALLGLINGLIVVFTGIPSFIATLGTLLAYRGLVRALGGGQATGYTPETKPLLFAVVGPSSLRC
jgi:simple sugar transport system permease protein